MWLVAPALTIAFMVFVIALLGYFPDTRVALMVGLPGWYLTVGYLPV